MGSYVVSTPADEPPITVEQARLHCRIDQDTEDALLESWIYDAVQAWESYTGVLLMPQVVDRYLDAFCPVIELARAPIRSITSIIYTDTAGVSQTLDAADYQADLASRKARIAPAYGKVWPVTRSQFNAVRVRFAAGYADTEQIPADIIAALRLYVGHRYENRQDVVLGTIVTQLPNAYRAVADRYRISWFA